jgi:glycosyltransferase involved in cell wall biosynthesis
MRLLHISSARTLGGGERHLADLVNALSKRGHEVYVAIPLRSPLREELSALPSDHIFTLRLRNALDLSSALELRRLTSEHQIEIVHAHLARDYPLAAMATKRNRHTKLFITRHVLFPLNKLHRATLSHAARVIAVSDAVKRALLAQKIFPANKITVIPNGIDFHRLETSLQNSRHEDLRPSLKLQPERLLVGTIGELKPQKGHEDFLRAAAIVSRQRTDTHFIIAGADTTRAGTSRASLERLTNECQLNDRVHLIGWLDDIAPMLTALDVYASASHTESFGLSIVEAMAAALPVVATATEGAREIIESEDTGTLVPVGDVESLASAILRLLENSSERTRIGQLAQASVRARFTLERMVEATEQTYFETMNDER